MQLQINTDNKTITIQEETNVAYLLMFLENNLKDWKEYKLVPQSAICVMSQWPVKPYEVWCGNPDNPSITYTHGSVQAE